jgi:hypothetical protein
VTDWGISSGPCGRFKEKLRARFPPGANQEEVATLQAKGSLCRLATFHCNIVTEAPRKVSGRTYDKVLLLRSVIHSAYSSKSLRVEYHVFHLLHIPHSAQLNVHCKQDRCSISQRRIRARGDVCQIQHLLPGHADDGSDKARGVLERRPAGGAGRRHRAP